MHKWVGMYQELGKDFSLLPLSYSKLSTAIRCPGEFKLRYLSSQQDKFETETKLKKVGGRSKTASVGRNVGSFVHKVLEECVNRGIAAKDWHPEYIDFDMVWANCGRNMGLTLEEYTSAQSLRENTEAILNRLLKIRYQYGLELFPESTICITADGRFINGYRKESRFFYGKVDLIGLAKFDSIKRGFILDYKTYEESAHRGVDQQLSIYSYIFSNIHKLDKLQIACAYIPSGSIKQLKTVTPDNPEVEGKECVEEMLSKAYQIIKDGNFPYKKNEFCGHCDYLSICPVN